MGGVRQCVCPAGHTGAMGAAPDPGGHQHFGGMPKVALGAPCPAFGGVNPQPTGTTPAPWLG